MNLKHDWRDLTLPYSSEPGRACRACWLLLLACGLMSGQLRAAPLTFYVATNGNDNWSGRQAAPTRNGRDGPLASLPAALRAARAARGDATKTAQGISIFLRSGRYELSEPVVLTPEDSGASARQPLIIAGYQGEKPVLSGSRRITGWKRVEGKPGLWQAEVPGVREGTWSFRSLFIDGRRQQRARTPTVGFFRIVGESPQSKPARFKYNPGEIKKEWAADGDVEVIAYFAWADIRMQIREVDEDRSVVTLSGNPRESNRENNARYFVENAPDGVDAPGEWYLNRKTGVLTSQAEAAADLERAEVLAPRLNRLLIVQGDFARQRPLRHVVLRGLTFSHTDWELAQHGYADTQAAIEIHGDVRAEAAVDCVVEDCVFSHLAGYALELGRGCQHDQVVGNEMFDLGGGGVRIGEPGPRKLAFEQNHSHLVTDNHMHRMGLIYPPASGVFVLQSGQNRIAYNHIHDLFYTAVSVGWNWGYQETPCHDNRVEFNHLHDLGQFLLSDMGAVYTLGIQKGTVVRNNLIHDVNSFTYGGWGLYPDEGSTDIVWENNIVYRTKSAGFHQHYGRDNIVRNNIFAFGREHQLMRTRAEAHQSFLFTNNIVYFDSGSLLGSNWGNDHYGMDGNLYFDARPDATAEAMRFAGVPLAQWRQRGHDLQSIVADPLFEDPLHYDFRLKPQSPALKLGFKPIDLSEVGVRPKSRRGTE